LFFGNWFYQRALETTFIQRQREPIFYNMKESDIYTTWKNFFTKFIRNANSCHKIAKIKKVKKQFEKSKNKLKRRTSKLSKKNIKCVLKLPSHMYMAEWEKHQSYNIQKNQFDSCNMNWKCVYVSQVETKTEKLENYIKVTTHKQIQFDSCNRCWNIWVYVRFISWNEYSNTNHNNK